MISRKILSKSTDVYVDSFEETPEGKHFMGALLDDSAGKFGLTASIALLTEETDTDSFFKDVAKVVKNLNLVNQVKKRHCWHGAWRQNGTSSRKMSSKIST